MVSTDEEEVVPSSLKKSAKQTENVHVASKEVQHVKKRYHPSFSFLIFDISGSLDFCNKCGVQLTAKILGKLATNLHKLTQLIDNS